jgi:ABC-type polysaccharide/polyol phosphate transport system ATPase subunit
VNIPGLNLAIAPSRDISQMKKPKAKAAGQEIEILSNAELRLKAGVHYGLLGHNGTGKSSE